jgi:ArsR family transcriptional regulator, arsenate/arsenite/antimonite-responsive transcriptional repressor
VYPSGMVKVRTGVALDAIFRALADPTRLRLLNLIAGRDICVCYFVEILRISQPKVSRHLAYLRGAGLVAARREGKWVHYRLALPKDEVAEKILQATLKHLASKPEMQEDISRMTQVCCGPGNSDILECAPPVRITAMGTPRPFAPGPTKS